MKVLNDGEYIEVNEVVPEETQQANDESSIITKLLTDLSEVTTLAGLRSACKNILAQTGGES